MQENTLILGEDQFFDLDCYKTKRNNNVLVIGASGAGKTRTVVIPNLLQATGSYVVSDPKGSLYKEYGPYLESKGYEVRLLNFTNPSKSIGYNFFDYIRSENDILKIAHMLVYSDGLYKKSYDPFWDQSSELLLVAFIAYLWECRPKSEQNLSHLLTMTRALEMNEYTGNTKSPIDRLMDEVAKRNPQSLAYKFYKAFTVGAIRTKQSVAISIASKLQKYDIGEISNLLRHDETNLSDIGRKKTAFFVQVSDTDRSLDSLVNLFFTQAMNELCYEADNNCEGYRLPVDVRFILDDFATNCTIMDFPRMISSIRSRGISTMLMIQAESQLEASFGNDGQTIIGNCDNVLYLGTNDIDSAESVARRANQPIEDILYMPVETGWLFRRGEKPKKIETFKLDLHLSEWKYEKALNEGLSNENNTLVYR